MEPNFVRIGGRYINLAHIEEIDFGADEGSQAVTITFANPSREPYVIRGPRALGLRNWLERYYPAANTGPFKDKPENEDPDPF